MKIRNIEIIHYILEKQDWISGNEIANFFGLSSRTIRNRIQQIKSENPNIIISSYKGYKVNENELLDYKSKDNVLDTNNARVKLILRHLFAADFDYSIYDLADKLFISDAQLERTLRLVKNHLENFDLSLERVRNRVYISGSEINKRKLLNNLIYKEKNENQFLNESILLLQDKINLDKFKTQLQFFFNNHNIYINDYGFNNIIIHLTIMIERISNNYSLDIFNLSTNENILKENISKISLDIAKYLESIFLIKFSSNELHYLSLIISNNSSIVNPSTVTKHNLTDYIEKKYIDLTEKTLKKLQKNYSLEDFSNDFIINLTIHIKNLLSRATNKSYIKNPLTYKFMNEYPVIYDMATFVIKEINNFEALRVTDDEIAFIAFHIGAYLENKSIIEEKIICALIFDSYYDIRLRGVEKIIEQFKNDIFIANVIASSDMHNLPHDLDLIITTIPAKLEYNVPVIECSILMNDDDLKKIDTAIREIKQKRRLSAIKNDLSQFTNQSLFKRNLYLEDEFEYIDIITKECFELKLSPLSFQEEVIERERLSSTSFNNHVAVPHSLHANCYKSFLYVIINEKRITWGSNSVNIILLIGTAKNDHKAFESIFQTIIRIMYEKSNVRRLINCKNYNDFISELTMIINEESY